jgi:hypothetical protein
MQTIDKFELGEKAIIVCCRLWTFGRIVPRINAASDGHGRGRCATGLKDAQRKLCFGFSGNGDLAQSEAETIHAAYRGEKP